MDRLRSFTFPTLTKSRNSDDMMATSIGPQHFVPTHSRESSGASGSSSASSPITPSSSNRSHNRWPSSSSSLATSPDSPINVTKSALHDLVEDPAERDDEERDGAERDDGLYELPSNTVEEPFCICDTPFCEHRQTTRVQSAFVQPSTPEWTSGDDAFSDDEVTGGRSSKRRRSGEYSTESLTTRLSRRWPSLSKRWKDPKPLTPLSSPSVRSAPPSRASSLRLRPLRQSLATHIEPMESGSEPYTPADSPSEERLVTRSRASTLSRLNKPVDIQILDPVVEPIDRQELSSTPLLPPMMEKRYTQSADELQSPLQSPSIADPSASTSIIGTPTFSPEMNGMPTPPLSSKPSVTSFSRARSSHALHPSSDIPPVSLTEETDPWAIKLGHANFHIKPEPYMPEVCTLETCNRLLDDWEAARMEFMRQAVRISENYGPTSQIYKFTEQKWGVIEAQWRIYHDRANAEAEASGEVTHYKTLAETQSVLKIPSLHDHAKFPKIEDSDIVGPMVQYAKVQRRPSKRQNFLRIFTDPAALLGRRPTLGLRR